MGKINSKQKGNRAEREVAKLFRDRGYQARRGQQFSGSPDSPDVVVDLPFHPEVKHVEALNVYKAMEQAIRDKGVDETPIVVHKRNRTDWLLTMHFSDFLDLVEKVYEKTETIPTEEVAREEAR